MDDSKNADELAADIQLGLQALNDMTQKALEALDVPEITWISYSATVQEISITINCTREISVAARQRVEATIHELFGEREVDFWFNTD